MFFTRNIKALALPGWLLWPAGLAMANDYIVYSPLVVAGQNEIESRAYLNQDGQGPGHGLWENDVSLAHTLNSWWKTEVYVLELAGAQQTAQQRLGYEFENTFQLAELGRYAWTPGFLLSYEKSTRASVPDHLEAGPLLERQDGRILQDLNLIWEHEISPRFAGKPGLRTSYSWHFRYTDLLQPGLEAYLRPSDQSYQLGPTLHGELPGASGHELEYSLGVVFGCNSDAPAMTWLAHIEYEFF